MLAVFERSIGKPPRDFDITSGWSVPESRSEFPAVFRAAWPDSTFYNFSNGNFMAFSHVAEGPFFHRKTSVVMEDIFCIFLGGLDNIGELRRHYGLTWHASEATLVVEAYKVYRDRAPYPPDEMIKDMSGDFSFVVFDSRHGRLFVAGDRQGTKVRLHWGVADDESLVFSDDSEVILDICGMSSTHFPAGCIFMNTGGEGQLLSYDHPLHEVRCIQRRDGDGRAMGVMFQVDLSTRLPSIPRVGSEESWGETAPPPPPAEGRGAL